MNWPSARSSRASAPRRITKREPDIFAARSKSIRPSASPISKCSLGLKPSSKVGRVPMTRASTLSCSSAPSGTSSSGRLGSSSSATSSASTAAVSAAAAPSVSALISATRAFSSSARAKSFLPMAWPTSLERRLRSSWPRWVTAMMSRRASSRRNSSATVSSTFNPSQPRRRRPALRTSALSRIQRMSCMGGDFRNGGLAPSHGIACTPIPDAGARTQWRRRDEGRAR